MLQAVRTRLLACGLMLIVSVLVGCTLPIGSSTEDGEIPLSGLPVVRLAAPLPNATYLEGVMVNIQATVSNAGSSVARVDFLVNNTLITSRENPNETGALLFSLTESWMPTGPGNYLLDVAAFRTDGTRSNPIVTTVNVISAEELAALEAEMATDVPVVEDIGIITEPDDAAESADAVEPDAAPTDAPAQQEEQAPQDEEPEPEPTDPPPPSATPEPTEPPPPSATPEPTEIPVPIARFPNSINVRSGPGTNFAPPIGSFRANETTEILAVNLRGDWLRVAFGNGSGWVFSALAEIEGDITDLPREAGPPTPVPTAIPPTATPAATATSAVTNNLRPSDPFIDPPTPSCGVPFTVGMTIVNDGSGTNSTGVSRIRIVRALDGTEIANSGGALVPVELGPGGTHRVTQTFTIDVFVGETHRIEFIADADNSVPETIENDNTITVDYPMPANCP